MSRTRLFGASFFVSLLINLAIIAGIGVFRPDLRIIAPMTTLKAVRLLVYHPPTARVRQVRRARAEHKRAPARRTVRLARATPAPPSPHPTRRIAAHHRSSPGRRVVRLAAASYSQAPLPKNPPAKSTPASAPPAPQAPPVVTTPQAAAPAPTPAPVPVTKTGVENAANTSPTQGEPNAPPSET